MEAGAETEEAGAQDRGSGSARRTVVASQAEVGEVNRDGSCGCSAAVAAAVAAAAAGRMAAVVAGTVPGRQEAGKALPPAEEQGRLAVHRAADTLLQPEADTGYMRAEGAEVVAAAQQAEAAGSVEADVDVAAAAANYDFAGSHTHNSHTKQTGRPEVLRWQPEPPAPLRAIAERRTLEQLLCVELPRQRPSKRNSPPASVEEGEDPEEEEVAVGYTQ